MQASFIEFKSSRIHYSYAGSGNHALFCFHGYGESEHSYHFLENIIPAGYLLIAIDMPYHGNTQWKEGMNFSLDDLLQILTAIQQALRIDNNNFSMIGYSMGGRVALSILEKKASAISKVVLVAPDGLKLNFWYWLATQTSIGNKIFAATINNPSWFLGMLKLLNRVKLVNQSIYKFVEYFLHDAQKRKLLYLRWTCLRKLRPDLHKVKQQVRQFELPVHLIYGKHDRIILPIRGEKFQKGIEKYCSIDIIESGHQLLQHKNQEIIIKYFRR